MTCPKCSHAATGVECERCGEHLDRRCPKCETHFTRADRFCRQCGRDLFFVNFTRTARLRFPVNLLPEAYEYPPDRQGLKLLQRTGPLRELTRVLIREVTEPLVHGQLLGTAVKVSEKQFPLIHRQASICERVLNLPPVNMFIGSNPGNEGAVTAFTDGTEDSACIFLSSGLVDALSEHELRFVIGQQMGHIKSRHVLYLTIAHMISAGLSATAGVGQPVTQMMSQLVVNMLGQLIAPWQRKAAITADRAGLLCCQNVHTAVSAMVKTSLGARKLFEQLDLEEYVKQYETLKVKYRWSESKESHPYAIHRVILLKEFAASSAYRQILQTAYDPAVPKILCHRCHTYEFLTDRERALGELACSSCGAVLSIAGIYCPHCHAYVKLADPKTSLNGFRCQPVPEDAKEKRLGVHHCGRGYFDGLAELPAGPPESHYHVLGIPESASERDVERAYLSRVKPTLKGELEKGGGKLTFDDIERRIKAQRAFQVLTNRSERDRYAVRLALLRELYRDREKLDLKEPPEKLPACVRCEELVYGPYCTQCGVNQEEARKASTEGAPEEEAASADAVQTGTGDGSKPEDAPAAGAASAPAAPPPPARSSRGGDDPNVISASEAIE